MQRVTVEGVREAYATTKLEPVIGTWFQWGGWAGPDRACPLGALAYARTGLHLHDMAHQRPGSTLADLAAEALGLPLAYVEAFVAELDGDDPPATPNEETVAVIRQARADARDVLVWLREVGRL